MATRRPLRRSLSVFLDTNVVVYAYDTADAQKQLRARRLLAAGGWVISTQVMQEFYAVATSRLTQPLTTAAALTVLTRLARGVVIGADHTLVTAAAESSIRNQLSIWDALIVESARLAGCDRLLTEDLNDGQVIDGVTVENPFT